MRIPKITGLQYATLRIVELGNQTGKDVRAKLEKVGERRSLSAFYEFVGRLREDGLLTQRYIPTNSRPGERECIYSITRKGAKVLEETCRFYESFTGQ
ncbi:MAG: hypothetical protein ACP5NS_00785 [Candidatus Pacearchaeota archaeon]